MSAQFYRVIPDILIENLLASAAKMAGSGTMSVEEWEEKYGKDNQLYFGDFARAVEADIKAIQEYEEFLLKHCKPLS